MLQQQRNRRDAARKSSLSSEVSPSSKEGSPAHSNSPDNEAHENGDNSSSDKSGSEGDGEAERNQTKPNADEEPEIKEVDSILAKVGEIGINQRRRSSNDNPSEGELAQSFHSSQLTRILRRVINHLDIMRAFAVSRRERGRLYLPRRRRG